MVYLQESKNDLGIGNDLVSFLEVINGDNSDEWLDAMNDELKSNDTTWCMGPYGISRKMQ